MLSVGQQIREQRLRLGLKLEEISARSRISLKTLQAIETDDLQSLSSPFLYKSFARQFAEHLKLDYKQLAPAVESAALSMPQPRMPGEGEIGKTHVAPLPIKGRSKSFRWLYSVGSLGVMLVACSSVYGVWQNSKATWMADVSDFIHSANSSAPAKSPAATPGTVVPSPSPATATVPVQHPAHRTPAHSTGTPNQLDAHRNDTNDTLAAADPDSALLAKQVSPAEQDSADFRVELSALEPTWLSIVEDGKQIFSGVLEAAQTKFLEGHDTARIRTGNAGGLNCVFNGKPIGTLGPRGQVRTVVFTKSNYEVLDAAAHIAFTQFPSVME